MRRNVQEDLAGETSCAGPAWAFTCWGLVLFSRYCLLVVPLSLKAGVLTQDVFRAEGTDDLIPLHGFFHRAPREVYQNVCLVFMWCLYSFYFFSHGIYLFETRTHVIALVYVKLTVYPRLTSNMYPFSCVSFLSACILGTCHHGVLFKVLSRLLMTNPFHCPNSWQIICARDKCFMSFGNLREKGLRTCFSNRDTWLLLEWRSE